MAASTDSNYVRGAGGPVSVPPPSSVVPADGHNWWTWLYSSLAFATWWDRSNASESVDSQSALQASSSFVVIPRDGNEMDVNDALNENEVDDWRSRNVVATSKTLITCAMQRVNRAEEQLRDARRVIEQLRAERRLCSCQCAARLPPDRRKEE